MKLTRKQKKIIKILRSKLNKYVGGMSLQIRCRYKTRYQLRLDIRSLRLLGYWIIANSNGYCLTNDKKKVNAYCNDREKEAMSEIGVLGRMWAGRKW